MTISADLPPVTYMAMDSLDSGVGHSQIREYVTRLAARGIDVRLHTFEPGTPTQEARRALDNAGVSWTPHRFGRSGRGGGLDRLARAAIALRGAELVHARSLIPAAARLVATGAPWVWDTRAFWTDQRIEIGGLSRRSLTARALRAIETRCAASADAIIVLASSAADEVGRRWGDAASRTRVITTCTDLARFRAEPMPARKSVRLALSGTYNRAYDIPGTIQFGEVLGGSGRVEIVWLHHPSIDSLGSPSMTWAGHLHNCAVEERPTLPEHLPGAIADTHALLCLYSRSGTARAGAMPTKIGEFLATGRPVVVSAGLGDMDGIIASHACGVALSDYTPAGIAEAATRLRALVDDPETPGRCRDAAEKHFDLELGVDALVDTYHAVAARR